MRRTANISQPELTKAIDTQFLGVSFADVSGCDGFMTYQGPDPTSLTIASLYTGGASSWVEAQENHREYAQKHGLNYFSAVCQDKFEYGPFAHTNRHPVWGKFALLQKLFDAGVKDVFWMDADAVFMNQNINLKDIRSQYAEDFLFTGDGSAALNAGVFFLKNSEWSSEFLKKAWRICPAPVVPWWEEQGAMIVLLGGGSPDDQGSWAQSFVRLQRPCISEAETADCNNLISVEMKPHAHMVPQIMFNAQPGMQGTDGQVPLIYHLAGHAGKDEKLKQFTRESLRFQTHEKSC